MSVISRSIENYQIYDHEMIDCYKNNRSNVITSIKLKITASTNIVSVFTYFIVDLDITDLRNFVELDDITDELLLQMCEDRISFLLKNEYQAVETNLIRVLNYELSRPEVL